MTTVIVSPAEKRIYCDGRISSGSFIVCDDAKKYHIDASGNPWFYSGAVGDAQKLFEHYVNGGKIEISDDFDGTIFSCTEKGFIVVGVDEKNVWSAILGYAPYHCYGSGSAFAMAALDHGKSPAEAIEYAMTRDLYTGGTVHCYDYGKKQWAK